MPLQRVRLIWSNFSGAPGYSNFYFAPGTPPPLTALRTLFEAIKVDLPTGATITYPGSGDVISEATGQITDSWSATPPANTVGTGGTNYVGTAGYVLEWRCSGVVDGKRPIGKTFIVPVRVAVFDSDGSITSAVLSIAVAASQAFVAATAGQFFVWHRPVRDPGSGDIIRVGGLAAVTSSSVPDLAVVMRSRRR